MGKVGRSLFYAVFGGFGVVFLGLMGGTLWQEFQTYAWARTPCTILTSAVVDTDDSGSPYRFEVTYRYEYQRRTYTSSRYARSESSYSDYAKAQRLIEQFPAESESTCLVNPAEPTEAILVRGDLWFGLFAFIPLIFVCIGVGGVYFTWRRKNKALSPTSDEVKRSMGARATYAFLSVFVIAGLVMSWFLLIQPLLRVQAAKRWEATPCVIVSSRVQSHRDDDGTTYSVDILYRYEVDGRKYQSNRYGFMGGSSSGYEGKQRIVSNHPPGQEATCYVSPDDPTDAVLNRSHTWSMLFGLMPLAFIAAGVAGMVMTYRAAVKKRQQTGPRWQPDVRGTPEHVRYAQPFADGTTAEGPMTLKAAHSRIGKLIGIIFACLFWNGIVSVFVWQVVDGFARGHPNWILTLFMIPFVAVGLGLIGAVFYCAAALLNPTVQVTVNRGAVPLGQPFDAAWDMLGRTDRIRRLQIDVEGREEATYRRGTSTHTDKESFATLQLIDTDDPQQIAAGAGSIIVPADTMHSFEAEHNKVVWTLRVRGDIAMWPNVKEDFAVVVLPRPLDEVSRD